MSAQIIPFPSQEIVAAYVPLRRQRKPRAQSKPWCAGFAPTVLFEFAQIVEALGDKESARA